MVRSFQIALAAGAKRLSDVYGDGAGVVNPAHDIPYRSIYLQAEAADAFVGEGDDVSSTTYGAKVDSTDNQPVYLGPFDAGPVKLSDLYAAGAGATLHILAIPF